MKTAAVSVKWTTWQKIIFRILFLFLLFFTIDYLYFSFAMALGFNFKSGLTIEEHLSILHKPLYWLDTHLYHRGYNPKKNLDFGPDAAFGIVLYISIFIFCLLAGAIWSWLDRKRSSYNKLNYWFRVYIRYAVAIIMLGYGVNKLIPVQMPYPMQTPFWENLEIKTILMCYGTLSERRQITKFSQGYAKLQAACFCYSGAVLFLAVCLCVPF